ncbi:diphosphomevalonate decarboxylase-like isoform X2 [Tigriopus californicus]|uniref:diphosphomevalonate decarboxylase-like isoform X2 n=1 Tax=Tigriopus californicus TaxID=6832 RepID=UPI0027DA789D|nr:diphosphomevalonate decarboxylase-like isoform X2 [Tigriopus californicus]
MWPMLFAVLVKTNPNWNVIFHISHGSLSNRVHPHMHAKTTVSISPNFTEDRIWLNGQEEAMANPRLVNCLREVKRRARESGQTPQTRLDWHIRICSANNFPTAAGLASSAAGYACLVYALCQLYGVKGDLSELARQGSGSACRSVLGGFVRWRMGSDAQGHDSLAHQVVGPEHWPDMRIIILVANDGQKKVPSSIGMKRSVGTSELLKFRAENTVPKRIEAMEKAVQDRDFATFAALAMKDSNEMHATCLDTTPPCVYMSSTSHQVSDLVHKINEHFGTPIVGYTFDAGPNACLFLLKEHVPLLVHLVRHYFPTSDTTFKGDPFRGRDFDVEISSGEGKFQSLESSMDMGTNPDALKYAIYTKVGLGPEVLTNTSDHLLDELGNPKM